MEKCRKFVPKLSLFSLLILISEYCTCIFFGQFSDWWDDYGDRYAAVKTQVKLKHQNKVKVTVTEWPEDMATWDNPVNG